MNTLTVLGGRNKIKTEELKEGGEGRKQATEEEGRKEQEKKEKERKKMEEEEE